MRLPDFEKALEFVELREKMGVTSIPELPPIEFVREVKKEQHIVETDEDLLEELGAGIEVEGSEFISDSQGFLTYQGRKVVAYIRDQRQQINERAGTSDYRFHLCDCATLRSMRDSGRERRYVATQRADGRFEVTYPSAWGGLKKSVVRLELCMHCRQQLPSDAPRNPFSLEKFFEQFDSRVPRTVRRIEIATEVQTYQPNQAELSREYKTQAGYRCQRCQVDCRSDQPLLQLHHKDGDPSNNAHHNLRVLCVDCHSKQTHHSHMGHSARERSAIERINQLRSQQGIRDLALGTRWGAGGLV